MEESTVETAASEGAEATQTESEARGRQQIKVGKVLSSKMDKTIVVSVEKPVMHRLYHRSLKRSSKLVAHDAENACREGDVVSVVSCRPMSKRKRWRLREILRRAEG